MVIYLDIYRIIILSVTGQSCKFTKKNPYGCGIPQKSEAAG